MCPRLGIDDFVAPVPVADAEISTERALCRKVRSLRADRTCHGTTCCAVLAPGGRSRAETPRIPCIDATAWPPVFTQNPSQRPLPPTLLVHRAPSQPPVATPHRPTAPLTCPNSFGGIGAPNGPWNRTPHASAAVAVQDSRGQPAPGSSGTARSQAPHPPSYLSGSSVCRRHWPRHTTAPLDVPSYGDGVKRCSIPREPPQFRTRSHRPPCSFASWRRPYGTKAYGSILTRLFLARPATAAALAVGWVWVRTPRAPLRVCGTASPHR